MLWWQEVGKKLEEKKKCRQNRTTQLRHLNEHTILHYKRGMMEIHFQSKWPKVSGKNNSKKVSKGPCQRLCIKEDPVKYRNLYRKILQLRLSTVK